MSTQSSTSVAADRGPARPGPWTLATMLAALVSATLVFGTIRTTAAEQGSGARWARLVAPSAPVTQGLRPGLAAEIRRIDANNKH